MDNLETKEPTRFKFGECSGWVHYHISNESFVLRGQPPNPSRPDQGTERAIVSVKGGENVGVPMIRDLGHVVDREKAKIGIFITLAEPTKPMILEAVKSGYYETPFGKFPKLQILTIRELFDGSQPKLPWIDPNAFKKAAKESAGVQDQLDL
jgi:hypothetical protein